ncbi:MAG: DUF2779 domain-containing protein [Parasporobacterium sp.]|nr:DUF2779 domain-containing protein [Parasporobacterium sp.]
MGDYRLTKTKYCNGVQCPKMLWLEKNKLEEAVDSKNELVIENGNIVGSVARNYFGEYTQIEYAEDKALMVSDTKKAMELGADNIAEASFIFDNLYCAVDILHRNGDGWDIVEVKSSTYIKQIHMDDMSFQLYVLKGAGIKVKNVFLMYINNQYTRKGELDLQQLFKLEKYTEEALDKQDEVKEKVAELRDYLRQTDEPEFKIGPHCENPYECTFMKYCRGDFPCPSVFNISRIGKKAYELYNRGIITFDDIVKNNIKLTDNQMKQVNSYLKDKNSFDKNAIREFLSTLTYPIYHLDFETFQQAVPEFEDGSPYAQIPFQYSLHIEYEDGHLDHKEFLAKEGTDPRRAIAESLCRDIPKGACSLAFNMGFEKGRIKALADLFKDLSEHLMDIHNNMHDLMIPFQKKAFYNNAMEGSYSIKYVLPALYPNDPELDYHSLAQVHNGTEASAAFLTMAQKSPEEIAELRENLLKYCGLDTYAMVKVLRKLREVVL